MVVVDFEGFVYGVFGFCWWYFEDVVVELGDGVVVV